MELLFHSLGVVILMFFYLVRNNGNIMYNVRVLPAMFRFRIYNRYEVGLAWKRSPSILPNNRQVAVQLIRVKLVFNFRLRDEDSSRTRAFLHPSPRRGFFAKVAGSIQRLSVVSRLLSDNFLFKCPDLLNVLLGVLLRFRLHRIPVSSNIKKCVIGLRC